MFIQSLRAFRRTRFNAWRFTGEGMKILWRKGNPERIWVPKSLKSDPKAPKNVPKSVPKASRKRPRVPRGHPRAPRCAQERPKTAPRAPQGHPRAPQESSKRVPRAPKSGQEAPKEVPRGPLEVQKESPGASEEENNGFSKIKLPSTRELDFQRSGHPRRHQKLMKN